MYYFWYVCTGIIKERLDSGAYLVEDSTEALEKIWRENIIGDNDDADVTIQVKHTHVWFVLILLHNW